LSPAAKTTAQRTKRLHLLDAAEIAALYDRPHFTDEERADYFVLTPTETTLTQTFTDGAVQAFFVLQLGYFKAKQRFFSLKLADVFTDLIFIVNHLGLTVAFDDLRLREYAYTSATAPDHSGLCGLSTCSCTGAPASLPGGAPGRPYQSQSVA
jgi:hypothetical protein